MNVSEFVAERPVRCRRDGRLNLFESDLSPVTPLRFLQLSFMRIIAELGKNSDMSKLVAISHFISYGFYQNFPRSISNNDRGNFLQRIYSPFSVNITSYPLILYCLHALLTTDNVQRRGVSTTAARCRAGLLYSYPPQWRVS